VKMTALAAALFCGSGAMAQVVMPCDGRANAQYLYEPWEENSRTYGNGAIRVAELDTFGEPAGLSAHLLVLAPGPELGPICGVISQHDGHGWADLDIAGIQASYDATRGLLLMVPARISDPRTNREGTDFFGVRINQAAFTITVE